MYQICEFLSDESFPRVGKEKDRVLSLSIQNSESHLLDQRKANRNVLSGRGDRDLVLRVRDKCNRAKCNDDAWLTA